MAGGWLAAGGFAGLLVCQLAGVLAGSWQLISWLAGVWHAGQLVSGGWLAAWLAHLAQLAGWRLAGWLVC